MRQDKKLTILKTLQVELIGTRRNSDIDTLTQEHAVCGMQWLDKSAACSQNTILMRCCSSQMLWQCSSQCSRRTCGKQEQTSVRACRIMRIVGHHGTCIQSLVCTHEAAEYTLQGHIWQEGFASGELTADLYHDVQPAMAAWVSQGLKTYIYSSGSRQAQKNLFAYTSMGDMRGLLSGFFDTSSGTKVGHYSLFNTYLLVCKCVYLFPNDCLSNSVDCRSLDCTSKLSLFNRCFDEDCYTRFSFIRA